MSRFSQIRSTTSLLAVWALVLFAWAPSASAQVTSGITQDTTDQIVDPTGDGDFIDDDAEALLGADGHGDEAHGEAGEHADEAHGVTPPIFLIIPFIVLLLMIATGPLFYVHHWHHNYPKYAIALGLGVILYYVFILEDTVPIFHAAHEYLSFIALLASLYIASGGILIRTDFAGTPRTNAALLLIGAVLSNIIGTTGASMLLIRPFMRLNKGRIKPYHVVFFIFIVSNVGGALTPIGDPPLFLGFLRGVPFFWTLTNVWYLWLPAILILTAIFYVIDSRNKTESIREVVEEVEGDHNSLEDDDPVQPVLSPKTPTTDIQITGTKNFLWLAVVIAAVFIDPNVIPALKGTVLDLYGTFHVPFGIREVIMFGVCFFAYKLADKRALEGNDFNFEPIREVAFLFIGIFATMQPALKLIGNYATQHAEALTITPFYFGTGMLSGVLDNAPTYVAFLAAAMGKFGMSVDNPQHVYEFAMGMQDVALGMGGIDTIAYLQAISVAAVFFGALTYIGNGPNFMVKAIAESSGVECPSFFGYMIKYSIPILLPVYFVVWFIMTFVVGTWGV